MLTLTDKKDQVNGQTPILAIGELSFAVIGSVRKLDLASSGLFSLAVSRC
jgi:hypothetical protein